MVPLVATGEYIPSVEATFARIPQVVFERLLSRSLEGYTLVEEEEEEEDDSDCRIRTQFQQECKTHNARNTRGCKTPFYLPVLSMEDAIYDAAVLAHAYTVGTCEQRRSRIS